MLSGVTWSCKSTFRTFDDDYVARDEIVSSHAGESSFSRVLDNNVILKTCHLEDLRRKKCVRKRTCEKNKNVAQQHTSG